MAVEYRKQIIDYLKKNLKKGYPLESLKWALIRQGYSRVLIENLIEQTKKEIACKVPIFKEEPVIKHEIIGENNQPILIKKSWWKKLIGL